MQIGWISSCISIDGSQEMAAFQSYLVLAKNFSTVRNLYYFD